MEKNGYVIDENWVIEHQEPSQYKAFLWREIHSLCSLRFYFQLELREHASLDSKSGREKRKYNVMMIGAVFHAPLTLEKWLAAGEPWKMGHPSDCYYLSKKYKETFDYNVFPKDKDGVLSSALACEFDNLEAARSCLEKWKAIVKCDHAQEFDRELDELLQSFAS